MCYENIKDLPVNNLPVARFVIPAASLGGNPASQGCQSPNYSQGRCGNDGVRLMSESDNELKHSYRYLRNVLCVPTSGTLNTRFSMIHRKSYHKVYKSNSYALIKNLINQRTILLLFAYGSFYLTA